MPSTTPFHALPLHGLSSSPALVEASQTADPADPALSQMTDLRRGPCVVADHLDDLDGTLHVMLRARVHMAFVTGVDGELLGHVSRDDLQGEKPLLKALADHVRHEELTLEQVMTPVSQWQVVTLDSLTHARLGDVVATLRAHSLRYLLVLAPQGPQQAVCGVFSAQRLEQALGVPVGADLHSRNFAELESVLGGR